MQTKQPDWRRIHKLSMEECYEVVASTSCIYNMWCIEQEKNAMCVLIPQSRRVHRRINYSRCLEEIMVKKRSRHEYSCILSLFGQLSLCKLLNKRCHAIKQQHHYTILSPPFKKKHISPHSIRRSSGSSIRRPLLLHSLMFRKTQSHPLCHLNVSTRTILHASRFIFIEWFGTEGRNACSEAAFYQCVVHSIMFRVYIIDV